MESGYNEIESRDKIVRLYCRRILISGPKRVSTRSEACNIRDVQNLHRVSR